MRRVLIAVIPSLACGLLLAVLAFGAAWAGFEGAGEVTLGLALAAASALSAVVVATVALPPARHVVIAAAHALPMLGFAAMMGSAWAWGLGATVAGAAFLGAAVGPWLFGRLPSPEQGSNP